MKPRAKPKPRPSTFVIGTLYLLELHAYRCLNPPSCSGHLFADHYYVTCHLGGDWAVILLHGLSI